MKHDTKACDVTLKRNSCKIDYDFITTNYWEGIVNAIDQRYPNRCTKRTVVEDKVEAAPVEQVVIPEPEDVKKEEPTEVVEEAPKLAYKKIKKNVAATAIGFVSALLAVALGVVSYFKIDIILPYTSYFSNFGTADVYNGVVGIVTGDVSGMLGHGFFAAFILAGILAVSGLITALVALGSKKKMVSGAGVLSLVALITNLGIIVIAFFRDAIGTDMASILDFINPMKESGVQFGLYIGTALLLIASVCGFASYKEVK